MAGLETITKTILEEADAEARQILDQPGRTPSGPWPRPGRDGG
jgi:hypothetical protein